MDLGAGSGGRPSKIMKTIDSVREVCTFREKACILYGRCAFFKKKPCIPLGRGEHEVRTSAAFWSLFSESSHLPSVLAVFDTPWVGTPPTAASTAGPTAGWTRLGGPVRQVGVAQYDLLDK